MANNLKGRGWLMRRRARRAQGEGEGSTKRRQIRASKRAANSKKGCSTKLFMLVLPLIAVGAYLLHLA
jgi:hypothetical protein